ncbi:hypothetical protein CRC_02408 [Cylindrospermopsis raciborskii CS-505]|nr:hypothetical protein CRC_02408 [Cylindrospermopsis raciborskii CS-505]
MYIEIKLIGSIQKNILLVRIESPELGRFNV